MRPVPLDGQALARPLRQPLRRLQRRAATDVHVGSCSTLPGHLQNCSRPFRSVSPHASYSSSQAVSPLALRHCVLLPLRLLFPTRPSSCHLRSFLDLSPCQAPLPRSPNVLFRLALRLPFSACARLVRFPSRNPPHLRPLTPIHLPSQSGFPG